MRAEVKITYAANHLSSLVCRREVRAHKPATLIAEFANAVISFRRGMVLMKQRVENAHIFLRVCVDVEQGGRESKKRGGETAGTDVGDAQDSAHDVSRVAEVIFLSVTISSIPNL